MGFAQNLREARLKANLSQQALADELGLCRTAIVHYEDGKSLPQARNLDKLLKILDVTYEELFKP